MIEILDGELDALISMTSIGKRRHSCSRHVIFYVSNTPREAGCPARCQNISQEGFAVVSGLPVEPGLMLTFEVESTKSANKHRFDGQVIHATAIGPNQWLVGCRLSTVLTEAELQKFLEDS